VLKDSECPGFGQDRVNFHQNPGRDTAGRAYPTWPNKAGYSIPCDVMLGSGGGKLGGGNSLGLGRARHRSGPGEQLCGLCGLCCVFSLSVSLLLLFPLFAVLLNCPYPNPPWRGEGRPHSAFVAGSRNQTRTFKLGAQAWGSDNGRAEQRVLKQLSQILLNFFIRIYCVS